MPLKKTLFEMQPDLPGGKKNKNKVLLLCKIILKQFFVGFEMLAVVI